MRFVHSRMGAAALLVTTACIGLGGTSSAHANRPIGQGVQAVVVKSWGGCDSDSLLWKKLNTTWPDLGEVPIHVDFRNHVLCRSQGTFTLADLEASEADVVILSDTDGHQFTDAEVDALREYAEAGHDLIGTFYTFAYQQIDNGPIARLFGLVDHGWQEGSRTDDTYDLRVAKHSRIANTLFRSLPDPYVSSGYPESQLPADRAWSRNDLAGAKIVAASADASAAITVFERLDYHATYISTMPEYFGNADDLQFLYNAIIFPK